MWRGDAIDVTPPHLEDLTADRRISVSPEELPDLDKLKEEIAASIEKAQGLVDEFRIVREHESTILGEPPSLDRLG
jgi:hypothetical protein